MGCKILSENRWLNIITLDLSISEERKVKAKLEIEAVEELLKENGLSY